MASSYSADLKLELMVTGENAGTWGDKTNNNLNLVQQAVAGFEQVTLSSGGTLTLAMTDGVISNARNLVIKFATASIAASTICTIPDSIEKFYIFDATGLTNPTNLTIKTVSGSGFTLDAAKIYAAYSDGTNLNEISLDTLGGTVAAANITGTISTAQIADDAVTSAKLADNAVVTAAINADAVTQAKIADDAVGADQLANTAVTAGDYTTTSLTVDAQGRITAASSGAAGGGAFIPRLVTQGSGSGTWTANPSGTIAGAYIMSGGGGAGGGSGGNPGNGGNGGAGAFGFYLGPVSGGSSNPYVVGAGGNGGNGGGNSGNAGGAGNVSNTLGFTVNGGNAGNGGSGNSNGSSGNAGTNAPGVNIQLDRSFNFLLEGGNPGAGNPANQAPGGAGGAGFMVVYDNGGS